MTQEDRARAIGLLGREAAEALGAVTQAVSMLTELDGRGQALLSGMDPTSEMGRKCDRIVLSIAKARSKAAQAAALLPNEAWLALLEIEEDQSAESGEQMSEVRYQGAAVGSLASEMACVEI